MDTHSNRKNDALHTTYHTPHTVSATIQQPQNVTGPRLGPRTLDRTSTGINARSTGAPTCRAKIQWGFENISTFSLFLDLRLLICLFCALSYPHFVVQNSYVVPISPSSHYTYLVLQFLYMCFCPPVHPGPMQYCWYAILVVRVLSVSQIQD